VVICCTRVSPLFEMGGRHEEVLGPTPETRAVQELGRISLRRRLA
jgi:hypothetical protein